MPTLKSLRAHAQLALAVGLAFGLAVGSAAQTRGGGVPSEGIKVHGHWTIEVRNPDGSLSARHEFENGLAEFGQERLPLLLARSNTVGPWAISLTSSTPPCRAGGSPILCLLFEPIPNFTPDGTSRFATLNLPSVPAAGPNANALVLSGSLTAAADGSIDDVATIMLVCLPTKSPSECDRASAVAGDGQRFSRRVLATPIAVVAGQMIQVTVVIRFS